MVGDEPADALGQPGAAGPVRRRRAGPGERLVGVADGELPGEPGQPGGEDERLRPRPGDRALQQRQVDPGVGLHRAGDVAEQHQPPRACVRRWACTSRAGSPPVRCAARTVRRRSSRSPRRRVGRVRRLRRSGVLSTSRRTRSRTPASSSAVRSANDVCRSRSSVDGDGQQRPRARSSSPSSSTAGRARSRPRAVPGCAGRSSGGAGAGARLAADRRRRVRVAAAVGGVEQPVEDRGEDRVEHRQLGPVGDQRDPAGPVERGAVDRRHELQRPGQPGRPLRGRRQAGPVQRRGQARPPAGPRPTDGRSGTGQPGRPAGAGQLLVVAVLQHRAPAAPRPRRRPGGSARAGSAPRPSR